MTTITNFFSMGGYAFYVWGSYATVAGWLLLQWYFPWRRWKKFQNDVNQPS